MARALIMTPILVVLAMLAVSAQGDVNSVRDRLERRFEVLPIANGVVLRPRFKTDVRSIEVSDSAIAVDGAAVTGAELRKRLGADADLVLQLSYLDPQARRSLAGVRQSPAVPAAPAAPEAPAIPNDPEPDFDSAGRPAPRARRRDDIVRIGGSVSVAADETVRGDVVVIGGNATVDGHVDGELTVVGGSATLGAQADIQRDVTVVGGTLVRDPKAVIRGRVQEVGFGGGPWRGGEWVGRERWSWDPIGRLFPIARLVGTLVRIALLALLTALVMVVARTPVEQIADQVAAEPVKSWVVGFLAEILFVPVLVMTVVVLAISIIGIPLLLLVPVAIVAGIILMLVGFTGVAYHFGRLLQQRIDALSARPYAATFAGMAMILSPLLLARLVGLTGVVSGLVWALVAVGLVLEYTAWTAGLGAVALVRFNRQPQLPVAAPPPMMTT
jgi:carbonic anhydrase/acetyltransferase-like protein (isoleucine patch superfamily)